MRYTRDQATLQVRDSDGWDVGRIYVRWTARDPAAFPDIKESFRSTFPRHGDALWDADDKRWSLPLHQRARLEAWIARTFESGAVEWDRPYESREKRFSRHDGAGSDIARAYAALHLLPTAPPEVVQAAHRALVKLHHPDAGGDHAAAVAVNQAITLIRSTQTARTGAA